MLERIRTSLRHKAFPCSRDRGSHSQLLRKCSGGISNVINNTDGSATVVRQNEKGASGFAGALHMSQSSCFVDRGFEGARSPLDISVRVDPIEDVIQVGCEILVAAVE